jgi:hypothetical protein
MGVASRLESMGALTQGDRRAGAGATDLKDFNLDTKWGQQALERMMLALNSNVAVGARGLLGLFFTLILILTNPPDLARTLAARMPGGFRHNPSFVSEKYPMSLFAAEAYAALEACVRTYNSFSARIALTFFLILLQGCMDTKKLTVKVFLNRLFGTAVAMQTKVFLFFQETLESIIVEAKRANKYSEGIVDFTGESVTEAEQRVVHRGASGEMVKYMRLQCDRGLSFAAAQQRRQGAAAESRVAQYYRPIHHMPTSAATGVLLAIGHGR